MKVPSVKDLKTIVGKAIWSKCHHCPVFSKFFDNTGPICHHNLRYFGPEVNPGAPELPR